MPIRPEDFDANPSRSVPPPPVPLAPVPLAPLPSIVRWYPRLRGMVAIELAILKGWIKRHKVLTVLIASVLAAFLIALLFLAAVVFFELSQRSSNHRTSGPISTLAKNVNRIDEVRVASTLARYLIEARSGEEPQQSNSSG